MTSSPLPPYVEYVICLAVLRQMITYNPKRVKASKTSKWAIRNGCEVKINLAPTRYKVGETIQLYIIATPLGGIYTIITCKLRG